MSKMSAEWQRGASDMKTILLTVLQLQKAALPQGERMHQLELAIAAIVRTPVPTTSR